MLCGIIPVNFYTRVFISDYYTPHKLQGWLEMTNLIIIKNAFPQLNVTKKCDIISDIKILFNRINLWIKRKLEKSF